MPETKPVYKPTRLGRALGALVAVWLVLAVIAVASFGVAALVALIVEAAL